MPTIKKQLTICHLISGDLWAGAEVMVYHLLCSLVAQPDILVTAIVFNSGRLADELRRNGIDVTVFEENRHSFFALLLKVCWILLRKNIDIIHAHRQKENMLALLAAQILRKPRLITTMHGMPEPLGTGFNRSMLFTKVNFFILSRLFGRVVMVSDEMRTVLMTQVQFSPIRTVTIHNAAPQPSLQNSTKETQYRPFTIGSAGRLVPIKNFPLFIAVAGLLKNENNIQFLLAGDGPLASKLWQKIVELKLSNISFMGHVDNMVDFYERINLYVNTSQHEGIPMTILEAMGRGIPVIAPRVGGIPEIIDDGVDGFLITDREAKNYAEKCILLSNDRRRYNTMSQAAKKKIKERFSIAAMTREYVRTYSDLLVRH